MDALNPVWKEKFYIGTEYTAGSGGAEGTWTYAALCKGIESVEPTVNEQNQQYFFLCGQGGADNEVTGIAPEYAVSGRRIIGDAAQDYIFGQKYKLGSERETDAKVEFTADGYDYEIVFDCTIANIQELGGATEENSAISFEIHVDGKPTLTKTAHT